LLVVSYTTFAPLPKRPETAVLRVWCMTATTGRRMVRRWGGGW